MFPELNDNLQFLVRENVEIIVIFQQFCSFRYLTFIYSAKTLFCHELVEKKTDIIFFFLFDIIQPKRWLTLLASVIWRWHS